MILKQGDMFSRVGSCSIILFGANSTVNIRRSDSIPRLVMGGGAAKQALDLFPTSDEVFGSILHKNKLDGGYFGLIMPYQYPACVKDGTILGAIQSKVEVWNPSSLGLVEYSVNLLHAMAHNFDSVVTHVLGCGLGGLDLNDSLDIMDKLPDNVEVWVSPSDKLPQGIIAADNVTEKLIGMTLPRATE